MAIINQIMVEVFDVVERAARLEARNGVGSVTQGNHAAATTTTASASATNTGTSGGGGGQSPLLFFVALGFGVVFTNLWHAFFAFSSSIRTNISSGLSLVSSIAFDTMHEIELSHVERTPMRFRSTMSQPDDHIAEDVRKSS